MSPENWDIARLLWPVEIEPPYTLGGGSAEARALYCAQHPLAKVNYRHALAEHAPAFAEHGDATAYALFSFSALREAQAPVPVVECTARGCFILPSHSFLLKGGARLPPVSSGVVLCGLLDGGLCLGELVGRAGLGFLGLGFLGLGGNLGGLGLDSRHEAGERLLVAAD